MRLAGLTSSAQELASPLLPQLSVGQHGVMEWTREGLSSAGFGGFVRLATLEPQTAPREPGVYVVVRESSDPPAFLDRSAASHFKGKDPTVPRPLLEGAWVPGAYPGRSRSTSGRPPGGSKVDEACGSVLMSTAATAPASPSATGVVATSGDRDELLVAWKPTPEEDPEAVESALITDFTAQHHGARPFANRKAGLRASATSQGSAESAPPNW